MWIEIAAIPRTFARIVSLPVRECGLKYLKSRKLVERHGVTSRAGVWIEITSTATTPARLCVTSRAGVWIEILYDMRVFYRLFVTSRAGVWIEILALLPDEGATEVTSRAGVWIEITFWIIISCRLSSLPVRECGLK